MWKSVSQLAVRSWFRGKPGCGRSEIPRPNPNEKMIAALRASRDQLKQAVADRNQAWLVLARMATIKELKASDFQRLAREACPGDPWDLRIALEPAHEPAVAEPAEPEPDPWNEPSACDDTDPWI